MVVLIAMAIGIALYLSFIKPTKILIVNALPAQEADIALNNDCPKIKVHFVGMEAFSNASHYDAVLIYGRSLFLNDEQVETLERAAKKGTPIFTNEIRHSRFIINRNITDAQRDTLHAYFQNATRHNYRNLLRYVRHMATPKRWGAQDYELPVTLPDNLFYHREYGRYFESHDALTDYLKTKGLFHEGGKNLALIAGINFPTEGNRAHVDTLISRFTAEGYNVYPLAATGKARADMLLSLNPDAIVYLAVGRLGNDSLVTRLHENNTPIFVPFPLVQTHDEWTDTEKPIGGGVLTARIVIPEIDGGVVPLCIATQNETADGYLRFTPETERIDALVNQVNGYMSLREKANKDKRVAICYFKKPGNDALIASGLEVVPSLYNFLLRLKREGYNVDGLPGTVEEFGERLHRDGAVMGSYAKGAQENFMRTAHPAWLSAKQYETWARETLTESAYRQVVERYGDAPGNLLVRGDSLAIACVQYGNILLFPQPRPALGDDDFKLVHGAKVAPPHSYIAPYLYMSKAFGADAVIHFGTHGNLEFTPGKNVGLSENDWAEALLADKPHFYYYTTGNVGEGIIAKRRTHGALITYLTPPYAESGMRQRYAALLDDVHKVLGIGDASNEKTVQERIKKEVIRLGLHRDLDLDSLSDEPYTTEELERIDAFAEEIANEKMLGAYYTLGRPYSAKDLRTTVLAVASDPLAYELARIDHEKGKITTEQMKDFTFVAHHYLDNAKRKITQMMASHPKDTASVVKELRPALLYYQLLTTSTIREIDAMVNALDGGAIAPAPGGDPVLNPNVLPTGRNMYSINAETTPDEKAWEDGKRLAEVTIEQYVTKHGDYPRKVSYTFWAGEFITTGGATIAQAFWMLGVEPVRDSQGRVIDLRLVPSETLGRPRINVVVQVSGQLRDIAASRLKMITDAVRLASEAQGDKFPNYVAEGTLAQETALVENGLSPKEARQMSVMRVFGPVNSGYSTGIMGYTESSGSWEDEAEIAQGYLNNMGALYGDDDNWGGFEQDLFATALEQTDVVIQPRQSNTWGPVSLDHVYEFTGGLSLAVKTVTGKEPDAYMADYRNRYGRRMQEAKEAIAVETRSTILNPTYIKERMNGGAGTAEMFGKIFRNIFGWHVMRPSSMDKEIYNELFTMYVEDANGLGVHDWFKSTNPAALQTMTAVMMESARKGYWEATDDQLTATARLHAEVTNEAGAACTEFVCGNAKLDEFISSHLDGQEKQSYEKTMKDVHESGVDNGNEMVLKNRSQADSQSVSSGVLGGIAVAVLIFALIVFVVIKRRR